MLLVLNVVYQGKVSAQVARDLHRSKSWTSDWLKRYDKEGIEGIKTRQKSGRPSEISEEVVYQIKKELKESNQGWTTKQIEELIIKKSGIKYHYTHIYPVFFENGDLSRRVPRKVHVNTTASLEEKEAFKKRSEQILVDKHTQEQEQKKKTRIYGSILR